MKQKFLSFCIAALLFAACTSDKKTEEQTASENASKAEDKKEEPWVPVDSATMMKNMMDYGTPGPMHQMLASWNGTWTGETTMWEHEGASPLKSTGTAVNTMIMGGKYQITNDK